MDSLWVYPNGKNPAKRPNLQVPLHLAEESVLLPDSARVNGTFLVAPRGWGKSFWLGSMCHQDFLRGIGTVVLDAVGGTVDNCLNKLLYLPEKEQLALSEKIIYCNMAGLRVGEEALDTLVTAWPMLYKKDKHETLDETAQRIVDLMKKTNKALESASVQGMPRVQAVLTNVFQILAANKLPVSSAIDLIQDPDSWRETIIATAATHKEVQRAATRLLSYADLPLRNRETQGEIILNRLQRIEFDVIAEGMFSATPPLVDWDDVVKNGKQVLIDLRYEKSQTSKELKLFWVWGSIYEYVKSREASGRERPPLSVVIDELSYFVRGTSLNKHVITDEFREFMQVYMRNANIWFTAATQEVAELPSELQRQCLKLGTHLYGAIDSPEMAKQLTTRRRWKADPKKLIKTVQRGQEVHLPETPELKQQAYAKHLQELEVGQWLAGVSQDEGQPPNKLECIETLHIDEEMFVNKKLVDQLKRYFMERDGRRVSDILTPPTQETPVQQKAPAKEAKEGEGSTQESIDTPHPKGVEEHQQSLSEIHDHPQHTAPQKTKKKDRRRRIEESQS